MAHLGRTDSVPRVALSGGLATRLVFLGAVALFLLSAQAGSALLLLIACGLAAMLFVSAVWAGFSSALQVNVRTPTDVSVGVPFTAHVAIENLRRWRSGPVTVRESFVAARPLLPDVAVYVDTLGAKQKLGLVVELIPLERGEASSANLTIETHGPFGLFSSRKSVPKPVVARVAPAPVPAIDILAGGAGDENAFANQGFEVRGVREWRPGDAVRHVHWRSTARTGSLNVLETGGNEGKRLGVVMAGRGGDASFEAMVAVAASTVGNAIAEGVECFAWSSDVGCLGKLTVSSFLKPFTRVENAAVPDDNALSHLFEHLGSGATLLMAIPSEAFSGRAHLEARAASSGIVVIDLLERIS